MFTFVRMCAAKNEVFKGLSLKPMGFLVMNYIDGLDIKVLQDKKYIHAMAVGSLLE